MKKLLLFSLILLVIQSFAQVAPNKYYIQFTDKNNSPYTIDNPEEFLTQRALDRRSNQDIAIVKNDIPVNPQYVQGVSGLGADILNTTRWMNGVTIYTTSSSVLDAIMELPYVAGVRALVDYPLGSQKSFFENESIEEVVYNNKSRSTASLDYGDANFQINQINGIPLHDAGYMGEGMVIAVLDGGFIDADVHPVFDSLWANNQILGTKDFVNIGGSVFTESNHGKSVLSCMGANSPGEMIGTAPKASYWLLHSEDVKTENLIEEYNWVSAAEFADSVGADVINSSLSYVDFDDPQWNHVYDDLDGNTAVATNGADIAASKGVLVFNSAGNSGGGAFPWNGAPADGDSVVSVGAVGTNNQRAGFSSIGPTADGRIRPVIMGLGAGTTVAVGNDGISGGNGTSFSSPVIAGMSTCLWQANPEMSVMEVMEAIKGSGSYSSNPNNNMGWGIPDYELANLILSTDENPIGTDVQLIQAWPNPFKISPKIKLNISDDQDINIELLNISGMVIFHEKMFISANTSELNTDWSWESLPPGIYFLKINSNNNSDIVKLIKQ